MKLLQPEVERMRLLSYANLSHIYSPEVSQEKYPLSNISKNRNRIGKLRSGKARGATKKPCNSSHTASDQETVYHSLKTRRGEERGKKRTSPCTSRERSSYVASNNS